MIKCYRCNDRVARICIPCLDDCVATAVRAEREKGKELARAVIAYEVEVNRRDSFRLSRNEDIRKARVAVFDALRQYRQETDMEDEPRDLADGFPMPGGPL